MQSKENFKLKKTLTVGFAALALSIGSAAVVAANTHNASLEAVIATVTEANQAGDQGQTGELAQAHQDGDQGQTGELAQAHQDGLQGQNGEADSPAAAAAPTK